MLIVGIDPGLTGAMCAINQYGDIKKILIFEPKDKQFCIFEFIEALSDINYDEDEPHIFLEKVHAMPGQGVTSMFNFGQTFGMIQGVINTYRLPLTLVRPQEWMKYLHFDADIDLKPKERSKLAVERLYPGIDLRKSKRARKPHDGLVDALLIAEYGRRELCEKRTN